MLSEHIAIADRLSRGDRLLAHRIELFGTEVDAIFLDARGETLRCVEVKTGRSSGFIAYRVASLQRRRLRRVYELAQARVTLPIAFDLGIVSHEAEVTWYEGFLG